MNCIKCLAALPDGATYCPTCGKKQVQEPRRALKRANGTGTTYKLSGRRKRPWVAAKGNVVIGYYQTKKEAMDTLSRLAGRDLTDRYNMTFSAVYDEWRAEHFRDIGESGKVDYRIAYKHFAPLHGKMFRSLRTKDYQPLMDLLVEKGRKYNTVSKYKQLLTQMSTWAVREELITTNYASFVRLPEHVKTEKEVFSVGDIHKLELAPDDAAKIVLMLLSTGMRIGELFQLPLSDYHGSYVIGGEKTSAGRNRIIPIRPEGRGYFKYFAEASDGKPLLLDGYEGNRDVANFRKRDFYPLLERLGVDRKTPHATRHTYASRAVREGMPRETLQKILGHANYTTTADVYVHADVDSLVSAVEPVTNTLLTNQDFA